MTLIFHLTESHKIVFSRHYVSVGSVKLRGDLVQSNLFATAVKLSLEIAPTTHTSWLAHSHA